MSRGPTGRKEAAGRKTPRSRAWTPSGRVFCADRRRRHMSAARFRNASRREFLAATGMAAAAAAAFPRVGVARITDAQPGIAPPPGTAPLQPAPPEPAHEAADQSITAETIAAAELLAG